MRKSRVFISFDYDNDLDLKTLLVGQSKNPLSPFEIVDMSIKEAQDMNWEAYARKRIRQCDSMIVICGNYTNKAKGVAIEVKIAQEESIPYFFLKGRNDTACVKPFNAKITDKIYEWSWNNIVLLIQGKR